MTHERKRARGRLLFGELAFTQSMSICSVVDRRAAREMAIETASVPTVTAYVDVAAADITSLLCMTSFTSAWMWIGMKVIGGSDGD